MEERGKGIECDVHRIKKLKRESKRDKRRKSGKRIE